MKHEKFTGHLDPYDDTSPVVHHHWLTQVHNGRKAALKYILDPSTDSSRYIQAHALVSARRDLRAFILRESVVQQ